MVAGHCFCSRTDSASSWVRASIICAASLAALACSSGGELPTPLVDDGPPKPPTGNAAKELKLPFLVDDYFVPNGCYGDGGCAGDVLQIDSHGCDDPPATVQSVCRVYTYTPLPASDPNHVEYLGVLFQGVGPDGESTIGRVPPLPIHAGAHRVVFWAKLRSGSRKVEFRVGGANNWMGYTDDALPYKDTFGLPREATLDTTYQQISIDLSSQSYKEVVSPFGWTMWADGTTDPIALYIADVRWE